MSATEELLKTLFIQTAIASAGAGIAGYFLRKFSKMLAFLALFFVGTVLVIAKLGFIYLDLDTIGSRISEELENGLIRQAIEWAAEYPLPILFGFVFFVYGWYKGG